MDSFIHIIQIVDAVPNIIALRPLDSLCILQKTLHFGAGTAIAQLQVVQQRIVLLGKTLIRILDAGHVRAEFIGIVGHVLDRHISILRGLDSIAAHALQQARGKAHYSLHVLVCVHACGRVCFAGVLDHGGCATFEKGLHTAYELFCLCVRSCGVLCKVCNGAGCLLAHIIHGIA